MGLYVREVRRATGDDREQVYEMTIEELEYVSEILTNNESNDGLMERRVRLPKR